MLSCLLYLVISFGWQNNGGLHSSSFLLPLKKLLLEKKETLCNYSFRFFIKIHYDDCHAVGSEGRSTPVWVMQCHDGPWRGLAHPSQGWHNLNLLQSCNILKYIKCSKSQTVFMTIINSEYCGIQLFFLSVPFLLAVEKGSWGIC